MEKSGLFVIRFSTILLLVILFVSPAYAQGDFPESPTPSFSGDGGGTFSISISGSTGGGGEGSTTTTGTASGGGDGNLHSLFSDAVYLIPPEFYRLTYTNPLTNEVYDSMCIRKGPETVCVPYESGSSSSENPCETFSMSGGGVVCTNTDWHINARVSFPDTYLDLRPYPATLVRWPTAARCGGQPSNSGSGTYPYVGYGGGSPGNPQPGDWRNLKLTLTLNPAGPMFFSMPHIGQLLLEPVGPGGSPKIFHWEVPSHPAAGGGPLAGSVGLGELPADMPLFTGEAKSPYRLFWRFTYQVAVAITECISGPGGDGGYDCDGGTGHTVIIGIEWVGRSMGGEIQPEDVPGVPESMKADLNHDGNPDAFWNRNVILRRMNDGNGITGSWAASYNFGGGVVYWGVREGQGQIGWPGDR